MAELDVDKIIDPALPQRITDVNALIQELVASLRDLQSAVKNSDSGGGGLKGVADSIKSVNDSSQNLQGKGKVITDLTVAINEYNKMLSQTAVAEGKLAIATSEEIKTYYTKKAELAAVTKALKEEADGSAAATKAANDKKLADDAAALALQRRINAEKEEIKTQKEADKAAAQRAKSLREEETATKNLEQAAAKLALQRRSNAEKADLKAQQDAVKAQRDNEVTTRMLEKAIAKLNAEKAKEQAILDRNANAYETLKREYNEAAYATKTLAAEYVILQRSGTASADTLANMNKRLREQQDATLAQSNALLQMEQAVGQNQRAVGNYANATGEITQILRELPNFAISAQTGILSLSNNLPMLQAALSRLAQTTDQNTGRAIGWSGVLKLVGQNIFSLQGLLVLGTTLMVAFGDKLLEVVKSTTAANKAQEAYNKALGDANKAMSNDIALLTQSQTILTANTATRQQQVEALNRLQEKYPEIFGNMRVESALHDEINNKIETQIGLLQRQAEIKAGQDAIAEATTEVANAQQELNKKIGFWAEFWAARPTFVAAKQMGELSESSKELLREQDKLLQQGIISKGQYDAMFYRIRDLDKAQKQLSETVGLSINPRQQSIDKINAEIKEQERLIEHYKETIYQYGPQLSGTAAQEIKDRTKVIQALKDQRDAYLGVADARAKEDNRPEAPNVRLNQMYLQDAQRRVDLATEGSKTELKAQKDLAHAKYNLRIEEIAEEEKKYKDDIQKTIYVNGLKIKAQDDLNKALHDADEKYGKKNKPSAFDPTNIDIEAQQRIFKAQQELEKQQLETTNAYLQTIYEDETQSLNKRLAAYGQYVLNKQAVEDNEFETESNDRKVQLDKIQEIEKRKNFIFSESTADEIDKRKDVTSAEKTLLHQKAALQAEDEAATLAHNDRLDAINSEGQKKEREIIRTGIAYQVKVQTEAFRDIQDQVKGETSLRLAALEEQRKNGAISEKNYWLTRQNIISSESQLLYKKEVDFLAKRKDEIIKLLDSPDISDTDRKALQALQNNLEKAFGDLQRSIPEPKKTESRSILSYLGFADSQDQEDIFGAQDNFELAAEEYSKKLIDSAYYIDNARRYAAETFGEGTAEYAAYVQKAQETANNALEQAAVAQDAASKNFTEKVSKNAELAKMEIVKQINALEQALVNAYDSFAKNKYQAEIDALDAHSRAIKDNLEEQLVANETSADSDEEKAKKEATLRAKAADDEKKLAQEKRAAERNEAIRQKRNAIFQAYVNGGVAISKIIAAYAANPVLEGILIALVAAQTATNIAAISARDIPAYWQGTPAEGHPTDGYAKVSDRGVGQELMISPEGKMSLTPKKETTMFLRKGTHIIPKNKIAEMVEGMGVNEINTLVTNSDGDSQAVMAALIEQAVSKSADRITKAILEKQENHFHWSNGELRKAIVKAGLRVDWVGGLV